MKIIKQSIFFIFIIVLSLSCDSSPNQPGPVSFVWNGTWSSSQTFNERGTFNLDATCIDGILSGDLTLSDHLDNVIIDTEVTGTVDEVRESDGDVIFSIAFEAEDLLVNFFASSNGIGIEDLPDSPFIVGTFNNGADSGDWHTAPSGMVEECSIDSVIQTTPALSIRDLCSDGTNLYAVADTVTSTALYSINPGTGAAAAIGSVCEDPVGIAFSGTYFYVVAGNSTDGYDLYAYDTSWTLQADYPKSVTGSYSSIEAVGWFGSSIICPEFFYLNSMNPGTAEVDMGVGLMLRADYGEGDGTNLWITYSASGYDWSSFVETTTASGTNAVRGILTPDLSPAAFTLHGGFLWTASSGGGLYKISLE